MGIMFFDLETQYLFGELGMFDRHSKDSTKLKLAVAGILTDKKHFFFHENETKELFKTLSRADKIVGHNLLEFDYLVLNPYFDFDIVKALQARTFDVMRELDKKTGCWISLDDLGKRNLGITKIADTLRIPKMWRDGKHDEVQAYLLNDLRVTKGIFEHGRKFGKLKYTHKEYGKSMGVREVNVEW